jgi:hypothetical protein
MFPYHTCLTTFSCILVIPKGIIIKHSEQARHCVMYLHKRRMYIPNDVPALVSQFHFYNLLRHSFPLNKVKGLICGGDGGMVVGRNSLNCFMPESLISSTIAQIR